MANNSNKLNIPEARDAMNRFKMESASEVGVNLKQGYNGDLTSRQAGSVGGQMVKKVPSVRTVKYLRTGRSATGHKVVVTYLASVRA
ncbi:MAG: alpha/beta-type small acid-soluble spore protein [Oscillospiraceae bacterium]|nr:alpha/beta-type small acid-soluble spore protein [Oscillospiraceae bacterium]